MNIERYTFDDFRFSFDATSYFTHNEYSGLALKTLTILLSKSKEYITKFHSWRFVMNHLKRKFSIFVGLDWANKKHDVCVQIGESYKRRFEVISHTPESIDSWLYERF
jgi:hypothetical protein